MSIEAQEGEDQWPYKRKDIDLSDNVKVIGWEHHAGGGIIYQIQVPVPNALRWVNAYALYTEGKGYTIIDPGMRTVEAEQAWAEVYHALDISGQRIEQIILTHYHPDHLGLAGWMQEQHRCPVYLSKVGYDHASRMWGKNRTMSTAMGELFTLHGAPVETLVQIYGHMESFVAQVTPLPAISWLEEGDQLFFAEGQWQAIETHGHAPGHMALWNAELGTLIAGDHVLPRITPNVSFLPDSDPEPLHSFMEGLDRLHQLPVTFAFPGHRYPFAHFHARIEYLLQHHEERLLSFMKELHLPTTAYALCASTFGVPPQLSVHEFRFALGETLAHLIELRRRGLIQEREWDGVRQWQIL